MLHPKLYPYRIAVLLTVLFFTGAAVSQELRKEQGFPLNQPIAERQGVIYCETEATAKVLVTTHAQKGIAAARDYFIQKDVPCYQSAPLMVTYRKLVLSVETKEGKLHVYEADSGDAKLYVITDWSHRRLEV